MSFVNGRESPKRNERNSDASTFLQASRIEFARYWAYLQRCDYFFTDAILVTSEKTHRSYFVVLQLATHIPSSIALEVDLLGDVTCTAFHQPSTGFERATQVHSPRVETIWVKRNCGIRWLAGNGSANVADCRGECLHVLTAGPYIQAGVAKLRPADQFNPPVKYLAHFFQALRFRLWTAVQQHWLLLVSCWLVCRSSTYAKHKCKQSGAILLLLLYYNTFQQPIFA